MHIIAKRAPRKCCTVLVAMYMCVVGCVMVCVCVTQQLAMFSVQLMAFRTCACYALCQFGVFDLHEPRYMYMYVNVCYRAIVRSWTISSYNYPMWAELRCILYWSMTVCVSIYVCVYVLVFRVWNNIKLELMLYSVLHYVHVEYEQAFNQCVIRLFAGWTGLHRIYHLSSLPTVMYTFENIVSATHPYTQMQIHNARIDTPICA